VDDLSGIFGNPVIGKAGQRFFRGGAPQIDVVEAMRKPMQAGRLHHWRATFARRGRELKQRGIPYVVLLAPSAHFVCEDALPDDLAGRLHSPAQAFLDFAGPVDNVVFDYPLDRLRAADGAPNAFRLTDSHWSERGAHLAYLSACRKIRPLAPVTCVSEADVTYSSVRGFGDLSVHSTPEGPSETFARARIATRHQAVQTRQNTTFYGNRVRECASATAGAGAALFFHDSFMTAQSQYWERSFGRTMFAGVSHRVFLDAVDAWRPDLVVSVMVETALFRMPLDHDVWSFADEFECDCRSSAGMRALQALRLYRQMKFAEAADLAAGLPAMTGFNAYHARVAAQVLVTDGRFAGALAMSRHALEAKPDDPSYLWMRGYAELYNGNPADAVILATWAVVADPSNAAWANLLAEVLIGLGHWDDAAGLLERVTPLLDDSQALWRNLAVVRSARGNAAGARQAERAASAFDVG